MATLATSFRSDGQCPCSTIFADRVTTRHEPNGKWLPFRRPNVGGISVEWPAGRHTLKDFPHYLRATRVLWQVVDGPEEWIGTKVSWELKQEGDYTIVLFKHQGWKEPVEFMHHCSTKWGVFLMSLKSLLETGKGAPEPNDIKIDNWN
jgi:hypothetical protein